MTAPIDGPNARAALNDAEFNVTALASSSRGTISVTIDCHDGRPNPEIVPAIPINATYIHGERTPVAHATASMTDRMVAAACVHSSTERREWRSASDPAIGPTNTVGSVLARVPKPTQAAFPVNESSTIGTATVCAIVPVFERSELSHHTRNSR